MLLPLSGLSKTYIQGFIYESNSVLTVFKAVLHESWAFSLVVAFFPAPHALTYAHLFIVLGLVTSLRWFSLGM